MSGRELHGLIAYFDDVDTLLAAVKRVRDEGYRRFDAHSPFPVHGIDPAMGIRSTILPWLVLGAGLTGLTVALLMQWWMNAVDYPFVISGKPLFGIPAAIPITFELVILFSAIGAFLGMLVLNRLPLLSNPLLRADGFERVTADRFAVSVEAADERFEGSRTRALLEECGAAGVVECAADDSPVRVPRRMVQLAMVAGVLALVPPALIAVERTGTRTTPRIHVVSDMDFQPKAKAQSGSAVFEDGRAMRPPVRGTVAIGEWIEDGYRRTGKVAGQYGTGFPTPIDMNVQRRGRERFDIYCAICHGVDGKGRGPIALRAEELGAAAWVPPTDLLEERVRNLPEGQIYEAIAEGVRTMPAYGSQLSIDDRWAIVAYVRALQLRFDAKIEDVPPEKREEVK